MKKVFLFILTFCFLQTDIINATNTDISDFSNVIYIQPFEVEQGSTNYAMSIKMKNTADIRGFQFDLVLPDGVSPVVEDGVILCGLNKERSPQNALGTLYHTIEASRQDDGSCRFLCGSQQEKTFLGNDGEVAVVYVNIASDMATGEYPVILKNIKLTETDISKFYETELLESTVTITEAGDSRILLDENSTTVPALATNVDVRVKRTIKANEWSTIVLPFDMTEEQVKEVFGVDVQLADFTGTEPEFDDEDNCVGVMVNFVAVADIAIEANHPYIIKVSQPISEFTVDGVDIVANEEEAYIEFDNGLTGRRRVVYSGFYGTYLAQTVLEEFSLFLNSNKFWYSKGKTKMKAFRAYFYFLDILTDVENPSSIKIWVNPDDATGIKAISDSPLKGEDTYNLAGQRVGESYKGIVVKKGMKVLK